MHNQHLRDLRPFQLGTRKVGRPVTIIRILSDLSSSSLLPLRTPHHSGIHLRQRHDPRSPPHRPLLTSKEPHAINLVQTVLAIFLLPVLGVVGSASDFELVSSHGRPGGMRFGCRGFRSGMEGERALRGELDALRSEVCLGAGFVVVFLVVFVVIAVVVVFIVFIALAIIAVVGRMILSAASIGVRRIAAVIVCFSVLIASAFLSAFEKGTEFGLLPGLVFASSHDFPVLFSIFLLLRVFFRRR
mmetsp:Transcript_4282/g.9234  ORF Transcript_4282/g.9234 Transcript_4282/m.9234 type:complete len:244 (+) Transcript_4282:658-1389(+)